MAFDAEPATEGQDLCPKNTGSLARSAKAVPASSSTSWELSQSRPTAFVFNPYDIIIGALVLDSWFDILVHLENLWGRTCFEGHEARIFQGHKRLDLIPPSLPRKFI
jgi:hypothetical protein